MYSSPFWLDTFFVDVCKEGSENCSMFTVNHKFEARVQTYVAVLNFGCEIQNSGGNFVSFSRINSCEVPFQLFLFKNMRIIRFLDVW